MSHGFTTADGWFVDPHGRHALLRGVNLGGSTKVPYAPNGATQLGVDFDDWADVSFVGRPAPLDELDRHLDRIAHWGFNVLRLLTTWEAIAHRGPGEYDEEYLDYFREVVRRAGQRGLLVFVDPHHDVWSRWTGGDGAPYWCFELAGLRAEHFVEAQAVALDAFDWPSNYGRVPVATMWTLFYAGDVFCPELTGVQEQLQSHYLDAVATLAERVADLDNVLGYDTLNEPSTGYLGRGADLASGRRSFDRGDDAAEPFSPLEHLAAADGVPVTKPDGRVLNPAGRSIWADGCPWRRMGFWDLDDEGRPALRNGEHFRVRDGERVDPWAQHMVPFIRRFRERLRGVHPDCIVFIEGNPFENDPAWDDPDRLVCNARHWYDIATLASRRFDPDDYRSIFGGEPLVGVEAIAGSFTRWIGAMASHSKERMSDLPMLLGEFGIPYEMNGGEAFRTGDYTRQEIALDANYRALDATFANSTHWNYTADNSHDHGDQWNAEDLSIFSPDDQADPSDIDSGARALSGFCRPFVRAAAGRPVRMAFDRFAGRFELEIDADPAIDAATEVYVPNVQFPDGLRAEVSAGSVEHDEGDQLLRWRHVGEAGPITLEVRRV